MYSFFNFNEFWDFMQNISPLQIAFACARLLCSNIDKKWICIFGIDRYCTHSVLTNAHIIFPKIEFLAEYPATSNHFICMCQIINRTRHQTIFSYLIGYKWPGVYSVYFFNMGNEIVWSSFTHIYRKTPGYNSYSKFGWGAIATSNICYIMY